MARQRITTRHLEAAITRLNQVTGNNPASGHSVNGRFVSGHSVNGRFVSHVGSYRLEGSYGAWRVLRVSNEAGACTDITGLASKRELLERINSIINVLYHEGYNKV